MSSGLQQNQTVHDMPPKKLSDEGMTLSPNMLVKEYCLKHMAVFRELAELRRRNPLGDDHFKAQRSQADNADKFCQRIFFRMMCQIGEELHSVTSALRSASAFDRRPNVLDLCMAPGGFTASVLKVNHDARVCGISLPVSQGGHEMRLPGWQRDSRIQVCFLDITMLAAEMGITNIPAEHPDATNFMLDRPFHDETFDIVFCDGQVLRTHSRLEYRENREAWRLLTSQLVMALQHIKKNGKIVVLLHKLDAWDTVLLLYIFSKFSSLRTFKPRKKHAIRSSFYIVAEHIQPDSPHFQVAVADWKEEWYIATFGSDAEYKDYRRRSDGAVDEVLSDFGTELLQLGEPIWEIQSAALRQASFIR